MDSASSGAAAPATGTAPVGRGIASPLALPLALLLLLVLAAQARPLMPLDETRYAAVAWEMWQRGDFLVPRLDGAPYDHKPPLLFWLVHAGWAVFGVDDAWPRLISPLCTAGTLALLAALARRLWPARPEVAAMAPLLLVAAALPALFATALMFDALLACFVTLGLLGLVRAWQGESGGFALLAAGLAGALFAKGPVALVHLLPPLLLAPWWAADRPPDWRRWAWGGAAACAVAAVAILAWALPAAEAGGAAYRDAILWRQSAGRVVGSFAHAAPWWTHLAWLPLTLAPWSVWPAWWRALPGLPWREPGLRLLLATLVPALLVFSAISGKRLHYLLPEFGLAALLAARALDAGPAGALARVRRLALASVALMAVAGVLAAAVLRERYDVATVAALLARYEREQRPVALNATSHGQWTFAGRLRAAPEEIGSEAVRPWLAAHPEGRVLYLHRPGAPMPEGTVVLHRQPWRGGALAVLAPAPGVTPMPPAPPHR